jgi:hypothetical protein
MKFAIFIVTFKNEDLLLKCINSIKNASIPDGDTLEINVINNFGTLKLNLETHDDDNRTQFQNNGLQWMAKCLETHHDKELFDKINNLTSLRHPEIKVHVINNYARPDFSTGHLSRSWNQCILHGFQDIQSPKNDVVILAQNDTIFKPNFLHAIKEHLKTFNYLQFGSGDEVQIMTPESVKSIGIYDERFCNIGYQEGDYFLRALVKNKDKTSINDHMHRRLLNPVENDVLENAVCGYFRGDPTHMSSLKYHDISKRVFDMKWGDVFPQDWSDRHYSIRETPKQFVTYPYFELALPNLGEKYFLF